MATPTVILDACVLYPAPLRDLLLWLAVTGLYRPRWTETIHQEWIENLLKERPDLARDRLERTRDLMNQAVPDCLVAGHEGLIAGLSLPDPDDRHVLAAAIHGGAETIVTYNLADFPASALTAHGIRAQHPDEFIAQFLDADFMAVCTAVKKHRESLRNPPKTVGHSWPAIVGSNRCWTHRRGRTSLKLSRRASFIAFTGTPIEPKDTMRAVFGDYIDIYEIKQAVDDLGWGSDSASSTIGFVVFVEWYQFGKRSLRCRN